MADDLFSGHGEDLQKSHAPLPAQMRPTSFEEFFGQSHLVESGGILRKMAESRLRSSIFYGPPGTGKTTAARILAQSQKAQFIALSAVESGIKDIRQVADAARERWGFEGRATVLFLDEIHRFSKSQQDVLLPYVEEGLFVLLGATTENPWVSLNSALTSRCLLVEFKSLTDQDIFQIVHRAWTKRQVWWTDHGDIGSDVLLNLSRRSGGDARLALTILERLTLMTHGEKSPTITDSHLSKVWQESPHYHDKHGDKHYDLVSAMIKSIRASDVDASLYWFGRLLIGGEDPRFIMRRVLIHAAEDIGMADPRALLIAQAAWTALDVVGLPEARIPMAEAVIYLASAPKSNAVVAALARLDAVLKNHPTLPVPEHLRDRHYHNPTFKTAYHYPHDYPEHFVAEFNVPNPIQGVKIFEAGDQGEEKVLGDRLENWRKRRDPES